MAAIGGGEGVAGGPRVCGGGQRRGFGHGGCRSGCSWTRSAAARLQLRPTDWGAELRRIASTAKVHLDKRVRSRRGKFGQIQRASQAPHFARVFDVLSRPRRAMHSRPTGSWMSFGTGSLRVDSLDDVSGAGLPAAQASRTLGDLGRTATLAVLIGNTRALWEPFVAAFVGPPSQRADPSMRTRATWSKRGRQARRARRAVLRSRGRAASTAHAACGVANLAHLSPCGLSIHPVHGPWIALRAVVVLDADAACAGTVAPVRAARARKPCLLALSRARHGHCSRPRCPSGCARSINWRAVAVRDACPVGRASHFNDRQIEYHYEEPESAR